MRFVFLWCRRHPLLSTVVTYAAVSSVIYKLYHPAQDFPLRFTTTKTVVKPNENPKKDPHEYPLPPW